MARNIGILASKEELEEMYWGREMSVRMIAPYFNTTYSTIANWMRRYGIERRPFGGYHWKGHVWSADEVGKRVGPLRGRHNTPRILKNELVAKYLDERMALRDIAEFYNISTCVLTRWFREYGIETRDLVESHLHYRPEKLANILRGMARRPTKPEAELDNFLQEWCPREWLYNGAKGYLKLDGKVPDFININGRKAVIELYGDYWHRGENPEERISQFGRFGYSTLIIWQRELKEPGAVKERVLSFGNK